ncbi:cysteine desulfurase family protein [Methylocystis sp. B8]|uniref:cysteine desulfurase family protein n=1 Tax=Methylocystis sp. B8 TaxID=544938 RepID=UPI0010FD6F02|nr:cysteine desulfurase family protein [Methylocystis sp. B8]TLG71560.1 cysteine desulfurase [Methylocystis sp. B8]
MSTRVYLDHNATSPLRPEARAEMLNALETIGNPSSVHAEGRAAKALLEDARSVVARAVGAPRRSVVFTSGATEAASLALSPALRREGDEAPIDVLLIGAGEHLCVLQGHRFPLAAVESIPLTREGVISLEALEAALARHSGKRAMLALQAVNNETGVIQPVAEAAALIHGAHGVVVCDAVQSVGRLGTTFATTGADILFFSSHKLGGPMGVGALAFSDESLHLEAPMLRGGGQEFGRRAGTENVAGIAGFAAALRAATADLAKEAARLADLRDALEREVLKVAPEARFYGLRGPRAPNASAFAIPGLAPRIMLMAFDLENVALSAGSACSSGKMMESHVLTAMAATDKEALRASFGWSSTQEDVEQFGKVLARVVDRMRSRHSAA